MLTGDRLERGRQCFAVFDFCRTAEWWSIAGKTEEERSREGQKITTCFRIRKEGD